MSSVPPRHRVSHRMDKSVLSCRPPFLARTVSPATPTEAEVGTQAAGEDSMGIFIPDRAFRCEATVVALVIAFMDVCLPTCYIVVMVYWVLHK